MQTMICRALDESALGYYSGFIDKGMRLRLFFLLCAFGSASGADLFYDDFSRFPPGRLSGPLGELNGAIQEYHYLPHRGVPLGPWANAICYLDSWLVGDEDGKSYLEEQLSPDARQFALPIFLTGDEEWSDYTVEARVKPLSFDGMAGLLFRYHTNRHYYLFSLAEGKKARLALHLPLESALRVRQWKELGSAPFQYDTTRYYQLRVENEGPRIRAYIDGKLILQASDPEILKGKSGVLAGAPARFTDFRITASESTRTAIAARIAARESELNKLRAANPLPKLWKKFETPKFGAGRNTRFGDLDGDGVPEMIIAQNIPRVRGDAFDAISCLTAVTLDGKILWQIGRPDPRNGLLTNDTPFQIHDIDGDGRNDVVLVKDFKLQILDGATGKRKHAVTMPGFPAAKERPYEIVSGDSIAFLNLSGDKRRHEILLKDRYENFWIYNNQLDLLWQGKEQTGHYPYPVDIDGDGRDEVAIGYSLWNHAGKKLWTQGDRIRDHADGVMIGNLSGDPKAQPRMYASSSDEGFLMIDIQGKILKQIRVGHNQSPSVGRYRPDLPGLQYMSVNFWKNPGIVTLFDWDGNILTQGEPIHTGSPMLPVNWRGDGQEFVLLSGNSKEGGMVDGNLRRVVMFPEDGHPDLAANVLDLTGDQRDEVVLWDQQRVWIYTQDRPFQGKRIYAPVRNPDYNESNYRTNVSLPAWSEVKIKR
jgi:rhamnogalacturonan endolyase